MDILTELDVYRVFESNGNFTDSAVWNTGEAGDIFFIVTIFPVHSVGVSQEGDTFYYELNFTL